MKTFFIYILILFFGYQMQSMENNKQPIEFSIELPDTIYKEQKNISIILKVENITSTELTIRNPAHWVNANPCIKNEKGIECILIKIKANLSLMKNTIQIKGNEILKIKYDFTLNDLLGDLNFHPYGKYDICFKYYYEQIKEEENISFLNKIFTKPKKLVKEKFIISNVFTFYLQ